MISDVHGREEERVPHDVDVHAERTVDHRRLGGAAEILRRDQIVVVPERGEERVHAGVDDEAASPVGETFVRVDRGHEVARVVDQRSTSLEDEGWLGLWWITQLLQPVGHRLCVASERGGSLLGREVLRLELVMRGESAAEVEELQGDPVFAAEVVGEAGELRGGLPVSLGLEDEGPEVRVEAHELELSTPDEPCHGRLCLPALEVEAEARPRGDALHGEVQSEGDPGLDPVALGDALRGRELVEVIEVDDGAVLEGALQDGLGLVRAVEMNLLGSDAQVEGLVVLESAHDFGPCPLAVEDPADRVEVVRLVGPRDPYAGAAEGEGVAKLSISGDEGLLGEDEERRPIGGHQLLHGHAVDMRMGTHGSDVPELVHQAALVADEDRTFVARLVRGGGHRSLSSPRIRSPAVVMVCKSSSVAIWSIAMRTNIVPAWKSRIGATLSPIANRATASGRFIPAPALRKVQAGKRGLISIRW